MMPSTKTVAAALAAVLVCVSVAGIMFTADENVIRQEEERTPSDEWDEDKGTLVQFGMDEQYPKTRHEPALVRLALKGPSQTRMNTDTRKPERRFTLKLIQDDMSLYKARAKHSARSTPLYHALDDKDMFCVMRQWDISHLPPTQIVEFVPLVTRVKGMTFDNSVVHHMDLFLCTDQAKKYPVETTEFPTMMKGTACDAMPWAYDRDGKKLVLPDHVGVNIGKGTPYTRMVLEWHYLLSKNGVGGLKHIGNHYSDHSGLHLIVTPNLRKHSAGTFGLMNGAMSLQPGHRRYKETYVTGKGRVTNLLQHDLRKFGTLRPVAIHLHMHNHGRKIKWERMRAGKPIGTFANIFKYKGFGTDQSFFLVDDQVVSKRGKGTSLIQGGVMQEAKAGHFRSQTGLSIKKGDGMRLTCIFDTRCKYGTPIADPHCEKATEPITYGLSHGQEMCGTLMMYYPHDPSVRMKSGMVLGYNNGELIKTS